jgi:putative endonuclease
MPCTGGYRLTVGRLVQGNSFGVDMYYVYVLLSEKDKNFYTGFSENIKQRLDEHNAGKNVSTKLRRPFMLIYCEGHTSKSDALRRENYFKSSKGKTTLKQILKDALADKGAFCTKRRLA